MGFLIDAVVHRDEAVCCESSETDKARIALLQMIIWLSIYRPHLMTMAGSMQACR
jgi:hypothetical protein